MKHEPQPKLDLDDQLTASTPEPTDAQPAPAYSYSNHPTASPIPSKLVSPTPSLSSVSQQMITALPVTPPPPQPHMLPVTSMPQQPLRQPPMPQPQSTSLSSFASAIWQDPTRPSSTWQDHPTMSVQPPMFSVHQSKMLLSKLEQCPQPMMMMKDSQDLSIGLNMAPELTRLTCRPSSDLQ
ncbi:hypothetical protein DM01DRAFT_1074789 [Hesseltinella vesiculosa]|uniref:Uncharacterized protein n=1 Tax=Hesseltinella vesiculosa TaxID=101127 RepID=A0A1X2GW33_9FUNG|nr:hypothetical protein DM01DRAFT_1074789 [Hesseltinella vesiculosa]